MRYTVYDNKTDFPVCVYATREQAAKAMGISYKPFSTILYKTKHGITNRWYFIIYGKKGECE